MSEGGQAAIDLLSGRTGARVWSTGSLATGLGIPGEPDFDWVEPCVVEPKSLPDLIARGVSSGASAMWRISGRDGRIRLAIPLSNQLTFENDAGHPPHDFQDLDGDGCRDAIVVDGDLTSSRETKYTLVACSLRDGKRLWSRPVGFAYGFELGGTFRVGDIDGDRLPEVVTVESAKDGQIEQAVVRVLDGRDGKVRWSWKAGTALRGRPNAPSLVLADVDGRGTKSICVCLPMWRLLMYRNRLVILDGSGKERARGEVVHNVSGALAAADTNGDGRDELLLLAGDIPDGRLLRVRRRA